MLSQDAIDRLADALVERINGANEFILEKIGKDIARIKTLNVTDARKLANMLKFGSSYKEIAKKLAEVLKMNESDIYKIFDDVARSNYEFAEKFYDYRGVDYIPYNQNIILQNQVRALAKITADTFKDFSKSSVLGYVLRDGKNRRIFLDINKTYQKVIDEAVISIMQGKDTFNNQMYKRLQELGNSGLNTIVYESGYTRRLDSAVRMNMDGAIANLTNTLQRQFGEEFGADGVEISVHLNSAPDHEPIQGHQFSNENFERLQNDQTFVDVKGNAFNPIRRAIGEWNCKHNVFNIVIGVSEQRYTDEELQSFIDDNHAGVEIDGKTYTKYEVTQMQRRLETEARKAKDTQILAKASNNTTLINASQLRITQLTSKYKQISRLADLPLRMDRMRVSGYKRIAV